MASGVKVNDECVAEFEKLKIGKQYRYLMFHIEHGQICVCKKGPRDTTYEDFVEELKGVKDQGDCCFAVFDMEFETKSKEKRQKIAFIPWNPDSSSIKKKMVYSSSKDALKKKLEGVKESQANDLEDLDKDNVISKLDTK